MKKTGISELIKGNPYVGRGIIAGKSENGKYAAAAYFIMGRSANSRNRIFVEKEDGIYTEPYDASKVEDPSLIIYRAVAEYGNNLVVTNGDQTDTIVTGLEEGLTFSGSLKSREFEPDAPNYTPRISAMLTFADGDFSYEMSILKSADGEGSACNRYTFSYAALPGEGRFIHTYITDGNPLPTFEGEPEQVDIPDDMEKFTEDIWNGLDPDNKISLYVAYTDLETGKRKEKIINKNR